MTSPTIAVPLLQRSARFLAVLTAFAAALALRPIILIMVTILALVTSSAVSLARPKKPSWGFCTCVCSTESGVHEGRTYDYPGGSCGKLDGIVCQIGDPSTGGIRTGSLFGCSPARGAKAAPARPPTCRRCRARTHQFGSHVGSRRHTGRGCGATWG
jgi:hypothetical protein